MPPSPATSRLRVATLADIPRITALIELSVRGLSTAVYSAAQIDASLEHVFGVDTQLIHDGTYYVTEGDGQLAAVGGWSARQTLFGGDQMKADADLTIDTATMPARIRAFFVHPDWARRGLGRQLYASCEAAARARGFTRFELMATLPGVPLYRALGFEEIEHVDVQMAGGVALPCIRMGRAI
ncbi:MAG TPA: GNAT family N-acetyltransferase [Gemmatimonadaceae bacterium]|nr:GNAT family N-acetyltransferase [Gemmatimonadaceae bacterium]